jgi:hypothetical protein
MFTTLSDHVFSRIWKERLSQCSPPIPENVPKFTLTLECVFFGTCQKITDTESPSNVKSAKDD